jgi:hypothetical protein
MFRNAVLFTTLALAASTSAQARSDEDDPENGQSWLNSVSAKRFGEGNLVRGVFRATDDFGVTRDREFRIEVTGSIERGDRQLIVHRYEPECASLAKIAHMTPDMFCDRLTLTYRDRDLQLAFMSYDANKQYGFNLVADPRTPGVWTAQHAAGVVAPEMTLGISDGTSNTRYQVELYSRSQRYTQSGEFSAEELRAAELSGLELSMVALGDVLRSFNAHEFTLSDLPRDNPAYEPTPYLGWAENPVEGGCIFLFCFGDLGGSGGGGGGGNNNSNACNPNSPSYNPQLCPWDLTYATWPIAHRVKIWKDNNDQVSYLFYVRNDGPGPVAHFPDSQSGDTLTFVSLVGVGSSVPLVTPAQASGSPPYGDEFCFAERNGVAFGVIDPFAGTFTIGLGVGGSMPVGVSTMLCPGFTGRPAGRYRLYVEIDPAGTFDWPGLSGNNITNSGLLDWVNLKR